MSDIQGALKELIRPAGTSTPMPWGSQTPSAKQALTIKKVRPRHKMIVGMHMAGWKDFEIARELGYKPTRVSAIINSHNPELQRHREELGALVADKIGDLILRFRTESSKSLDTLIEIRDKTDAPHSERRLSALAILDRAGYAPIRKQVNFDAQVPLAELNETFGQLNAANEVAIRRSEWTIKDQPTR